MGPFDIRNNQAFVGFDADQSFIGGGFTLQWNAKRMYKYDFTDVFDAHTFVTEEAAFLFTKVQFNTERALQNNPGSPAGFKKRRCAKSQKESVSNETVELMKALADANNPDFRDAMEALTALITEFLGGCRIGGKRWPVRVSDYADAVEGDRTL